MRVYRHGSSVRVALSADDVSSFKRQWPASGLVHGDRVSFTFEKNGDLVDFAFNGRFPEPKRVDGAALVALSHDAYAGARGR